MSNWQPLVSVVTPSYNQGRFLEETIRSVLAQDYPRIEHIIIDGGSSDTSVDILKGYNGRLAYWESAKDQGQTYAICKGFSRATGELFAWLNADDVYFTRTTISEIVQAFRDHPKAGVVYGDYALTDPRGRVFRVIPALSRISWRLLRWYCMGQPSAFVRRSLLEQFPLREELHHGMDYDCWITLCRGGIRFAYVPRIWTGFRIHPAGKTMAMSVSVDRELRQLRHEHFGDSPLLSWPIEPVMRRSIALWLRLRGLARFSELADAAPGFHGQRPSRWAFYASQLISRSTVPEEAGGRWRDAR